MTAPVYQELGHGITCLDAAYVDAGVASFYLLGEGDEYAVIETGTNHSVPVLQAVLQQRGIGPDQIRYVIPTHVHLDHAGGAGAMMAAFPAAKLIVHPRGARHMADPAKLVQASIAVYGEKTFRRLYGDIQAVDGGRIHATEDGERIELAGRPLTFRHTEGHARHHHCLWDEASRGWFTGDMFGVCYPWFRFAEGDFLLPATTPTQFDPAAYLQSLEVLASVNPERMYLTHFGMIEYSAEKSTVLAAQVQHYAGLALDESIAPEDMARVLEEYSFGLIAAHTPSSDEEKLRAWLQLDIPLNTQGLLHLRSTQS